MLKRFQFLLLWIEVVYSANSSMQYGKMIPSTQVAYVGSRVEIECTSKTKPKFYSRNRALPSRFQDGNRILFKKVKYIYAGVYTCQGYSNTGPFNTTANLKIGENMPNQIKPKVKFSKVGETVIFSCTTASINVNWYFKTLKGNGIQQNYAHSYILENVQTRDGGYYYCFGKTMIKLKEYTFFIAKAELYVHDNTKVTPFLANPDEGEMVKFDCLSHFPARWSHINIEDKRQNVTKANNSLIIKEVSVDNSGRYECIGRTAKDTLFYSYGVLIVTVYQDGLITPAYKKVEIGDTVRFAAIFEGEGVWKFNSGSLPSNISTGYISKKQLNWLIINDVTKENGGIYTIAIHKFDYILVKSSATLIVTACTSEKSTESKNDYIRYTCGDGNLYLKGISENYLSQSASDPLAQTQILFWLCYVQFI